MPAPPVLPKGVQIAVLRGNPFAEGVSTVRLKIPAHTVIAPHWHPTIESFSVLQGKFFVGMGDSGGQIALGGLARHELCFNAGQTPPLRVHWGRGNGHRLEFLRTVSDLLCESGRRSVEAVHDEALIEPEEDA